MLKWIFLFVIVINTNITDVYAQEITEQKEEKIELKTAGTFSYNFQRYTGFSFLTEKFTEQIAKSYIKIKTKSKKTTVDLNTFSGWDLIRKKLKSASVQIDELEIKDIPIKHFEANISDPIYIKKVMGRTKKKNKIVLPINIKAKVVIDLNNINNVISNIPRWKKVLQEVELPVPPFGNTLVELSDLKINVQDQGFVNVSVRARSKESIDSEPLDISFKGQIALKNKRIIIENLESEAKDIFTKDSDLSRSFSTFLEDLINPIFNLSKYEKKGLTIEDVKLNFDSNDLILNINAKKIPEKFNPK